MATAPVQRCIRHNERNVLGHLPERDRPAIKRQLCRAWADCARRNLHFKLSVALA